ncbi:hypothetical protein O1611_g551 [Lasiodiplodia mahajangana]|uniref:Uncharacterized protein n=1 Tax=Lasiodiplodia mahajangana TaxID=1108764 RepID=A0ACC2JZX3_9PEZI|nr:hypothetical protein O1611_g551 [Lasiodiplodia mahajangana]
MDSVYEDDAIDIDSYDASDLIDLDLYADPTADPEYKHGQARTQYEVAEDSVAIFQKVKTDYRVSVQRLLWVDGWRDGETQELPQQMTLVVLKFIFMSAARTNDERLDWAEASLRFWAEDEKSGQDPEVVAWAPRDPEQWNETSAHNKKMTKTGASVSFGYQGAEASTDWSKEGEIEWDQTHFDEGHTTQIFHPKTGRPNGVTWFLRQNPLQNHGILPEFWAAVLISRRSSDPYRVQFTIESSSTRYQNVKNSARQLLGLRPSGSRFSVAPTPGKIGVCNLEGHNILKHVNLQHLGSLVDPKNATRLNVKWGPQPKDAKIDPIEPGKAEDTREEDQEPVNLSPHTPGHRMQPLDARINNADMPRVMTGADGSPLLHDAQLSLKRSDMEPQQITSGNSHVTAPSDISYSRLVSLEGRVAQTEARIAALDQIVIQMQQAMIANKVQDSSMKHG